MRNRPLAAPQAFLFDVFGTVVNWRSSIARGLEAELAPRSVRADWAGLADSWRARYDPSMAPVREGTRAWVDLDTLHRESLGVVLAEAGIAAPEDRGLARMTRLWHALDPWPDSAEGLARLGRIAPCATCSNGHIALMVGVARHGGLRWDAILGAEIASDYKPAPAVYLRSAAALGYAPGQVMMVAAHNADLAAARALGFRTAFVARPTEHGPGQTIDLTPESDWEIAVDSLTDLASAFSG